ncbi:MAG: enoyl-CoA hydratase-related protein [Candidatus Poribacteria bacterium]
MILNKLKFKYLLLEGVDPKIVVLKISRQESLNALNSAVLSEMKEILSALASDPDVRVVVLTGAGDKAFIAGADIAEMKDKSATEAVRFAQLGHDVAKLLELMPKPTIAAVNGYALGGGTEMALACDFILANEKAVFGQPEVGLGVIPGFGATFRLPKFIGLPRAKELIYSGKKISAKEALSFGLVNRVLPIEGFMQSVLEIARSISMQSASAVARAKQLLNEFSETAGLNSKLDGEVQAFGQLFCSYDQKEGMNAFLEKRKPIFQGQI